MSKDQSLIDAIALLYKNRKKIIIACAIAAVGSAIISLLLPNYYQSSTQFYPASSDLAKPLPTGNEVLNRNYYGDSRDLDRILTVAHSTELQDYLIKAFHLYSHYGIDSTNKKAAIQVSKKLQKLYTPLKTEFDAVELSVEDVDPVISAKMANAARDKVSEIIQNVVKESQSDLLETYEKNISSKEIGLSTISDSLRRMREKYEIFNPASQGKTYGELLPGVESMVSQTKAKLEAYKTNGPRDSVRVYKVKLAGFESQMENLQTRIGKYNDGYTLVASLEREKDIFTEQLSKDKEKYKQLKTTYESPFTAIHVLQHAETPIIKSRPKRSLIVIGITFLTGVLACLFLLIQEQFRENKWVERITE